MKKILLLLVLSLSLIIIGCSRTPAYFKINGTKYVTNFYENLYPNSEYVCFQGDYYENSDDLWNNEIINFNDTIGYKIENANFDMYSILIGSWQHVMYVNVNQESEARLFYQSYENFYYYVAYANNKTLDYENYQLIDGSEIFNSNLDIINNTKGKETIIDVNNYSKKYYIYKISKDGLFTSLRNVFYLNNNKLYLFNKMSNDLYYGIEVDDTISFYFLEIIKDKLI